MALINGCFYRAEYIAQFETVHIVFKGEVHSDLIIKLRNMLGSLSESLKIEKLILDVTECDQVFIDYNSHIRIAFWKSLENHGLKIAVLIIPPKNFTANARSSLESFYSISKLDTGVSVISNWNLTPHFILNNTLSHQINQHYGNSN